MKKFLSVLLTMSLVITLLGSIGPLNVYAKKQKTKLSDKKVELTVGETQKIKLVNPPKKVKWKVKSKKIVKISKKSGKKNQIIQIKGLKAGKTKITAQCNKKKYTIKVTVYGAKSDINEPIVEVSTVSKPDAETTTAPTESTTKPSGIEETTTNETTTAAPGNFIVDLDKYTLTAQEGLALNYYFDGESDLILTEDYIADELEFYQDGQWISVPYLDSYHNDIDGMPGIYYGNPFEKGVNLISTYGLLPVGHYRYIATVGTHYLNTSTQEYPKETYIEFDIVPDENGLNIVAEPIDKEITAGEDLEILISVMANEQNQDINYIANIDYIDKYDYGFNWWETWLSENPDLINVEQTLSKTGTSTVTVPISDYFGELSPGHYCYTCEVAGISIPVEFDIVENTVPGVLVAEAPYTILSPSDILRVKYRFNAPTDLVVGIDENPYLLEMYQGGEWVEIPISEDYQYIEGIACVEYYNQFTLDIPLEGVYGELEPGHYRYTEDILDHHTNTSDQPYDDTVSVEFDIVKDSTNCNIIATTDDYMYEFGEDIVITYTVDTDDEYLITTYSNRPGQLEYSFAGYWASYTPNDEYKEYIPPTLTHTGAGTFKITLPISTYYSNLMAGRYIYTTVVGEQKVSVEFYINNTSTEIAGTLISDPMTLESILKIQYHYINEDCTANDSYSLYFGMLEIYENEQWKVMEHSWECPPVEDVTCSFGGYGKGLYSLPIAEYFDNLRIGHYRYWHLIGNSLIPVEFDIVE